MADYPHILPGISPPRIFAVYRRAIRLVIQRSPAQRDIKQRASFWNYKVTQCDAERNPSTFRSAFCSNPEFVYRQVTSSISESSHATAGYLAILSKKISSYTFYPSAV